MGSKKITAENPSIRCFIATAGVYSLFADIALENFLVVKQTLDSKIINPELTLVTDLGLNIPDFNPVRTIYRHPYAATVMVRDNSKKIEVKNIDEHKKEPLNERILIAVHKSNGQLVPMAQALINGSDLGYKHAHEAENIHTTLASTNQSAVVRVNSKGKRIEKYIISDFVFNIGDYSKIDIDGDKFELTSMIKPHDQKKEVSLGHVFSNGHHVHTHEDHGHLRKHTHEDEKVKPEHHEEHHEDSHDHKVPEGERPGPMNFNRDEYDREKNEERRIRNEDNREKKEGERKEAETKRESLYEKLLRLKKELEELREKFTHEEKMRQSHEQERRKKWHTEVKEEPKHEHEHEHEHDKPEHHEEKEPEHHDSEHPKHEDKEKEDVKKDTDSTS